MNKLLYLLLLPSILFSQTTPSVTPRADGEGSLGTETYRWGEGHFDELYVEAPSLADDSSRVPTTSWIRDVVGEVAGGPFAPLESPTFTGIPRAPTAAAGTNTAQIATTKFVQTTIDAAIGNLDSSLVNYTYKTTSFTAEPNKKYSVNTSIGDIIVTLPELTEEMIASSISIRLAAGSNNIIVNRSGTNTIAEAEHYTTYSFKGVGSYIDIIAYTESMWVITRSNRVAEPSAGSDTNVAATTAWVNDLVYTTKLNYLENSGSNTYEGSLSLEQGDLTLSSFWGIEANIELDFPDYGNIHTDWIEDYDGVINVVAEDYDPANEETLLSFKGIFTGSPYTEFVQPVKAPNPTAADDSTNVATTAWVRDIIQSDDTSVNSVAGKTGAVTLDADDVSATATKLWMTDDERSSLAAIGVAFEPSGIDDTVALQAAIDAGGIVQLAAGTYIVTSVDISNDVIIQGTGNDTIIKRKDGTITTQSLEADRLLFKIDTDGIRVTFRDLTIDENEANQNAYAAYGYAIGIDSTMAAIAIGINLSVTNCTIKNITNCGIAFGTGDTETVRSYLSVTNCTFLDGRVGLAAGNELVDSASGFSGYYISCSSFTQSHIVNNRFRFTKTLNDAEFPPVAIMATSSSNGSSGSEMLIEGNYFWGCGRGNWYNSTPTIQLAGNDLGVIDIYNFGKRIRIVNNQFENNYAPAIRGKTNIDQAIVTSNIINDTFPNYGISFGPSSLTEQVGNIIITDNQLRNVGGAGIAISGVPTGHSTTKISNVVIDGNHIDNVDTYLSTATGISCGYTDGVIIRNNKILNAELIGIDIIKVCIDVDISNNTINCGTAGISFGQAVSGYVRILDNVISSGSYGVFLYGDGTNDILLSGNIVNEAVGYAFYLSAFDYVTIVNNKSGAISGNSTFVRAANCDGSITVSGNTIPNVGITTAYYPHTGSAIAHIFGNSWNPRISYGSAAPSSGTYKVGDVVYNTAPSPSGYTGWICTTAGSPGTWKGFGVIES